MTRDFLLCSHCGSRLTVVKTDGGGDEITIKIRTGRKAPEFPLTDNRQELKGELTSMVKLARQDKHIKTMRSVGTRLSQKIFDRTMAKHKKFNGHMGQAAHRLGITKKTLYKRMSAYARRGWIHRDEMGEWVKCPTK